MKKERILNSSGKKELFIIAAALVAFFTIYSLVLPAITLDNDTAGDEPGLSSDTLSQEEVNELETVYDPFSIEEERENAKNGNDKEDEILSGSEVREDVLYFFDKTTDVFVSVEAPLDAFPEGTVMVVTPIDEEEVLDAVSNTVEKVKRVQAVDITFYFNGEEIEPLKPIKVSLVSDVIKEAKDPQIVHIDDEGAGSLVEQADVETKEDEVVFESKDFSTYVVVETEIETTVITADGERYNITVSYDENAMIPEGAHLEAEEILPEDERYQEYYDTLTNELKSEPYYVRFFDISIMDGEEKVQPESKVNVKIELNDLTDEENLKAVHIPDEGKPEVLDVQVNEETKKDTDETTKSVEFDAEGFSVYAVVGEGSTEDEARAAVNFYGKDTTTPLATVYVKNSDTADELEEIVYDPGCGQLDASKKELFDGWVISTKNTTDGTEYDIDTEGKTIEEVRTYLADLEIAEGDVVNIYAKIVRTITISYQGEVQNILLGTVNLKVIGSDNPDDPANIATYTINMNYTPQTSTQAFVGWLVASGGSNILSATFEGEDAELPYPNGTVITVKGDVTLSVDAPTGHWLVYDENGKGATYNAPRFIRDGEVTEAPSLEMVRLGYTFENWYRLKENVDIANVPKDSTGSYIITDENFELFEFRHELDDNITIYAKWNSTETANYTVIIWKERMSDTYAANGGTGEGKTKNYDFAESYTFSGPVEQPANAVSNGSSSVVDGDDAGTRYYNVRVQGTEVSQGAIDKTISYTGYHCAGYDTNVMVKAEGTSVVNVYYDRNTVTYTFYTYGESSSGGTWYLCKEDGSHIVASGQNAPTSGDNRLAIRNGNEYDQYTGRVTYDDGRTYYYSTTGACGGTNMREAHWEYVSSSSEWNVYQKSTGLYGESLDWPEDTSIWWYESHNATSGTGTRMTYKDAFLPLDDDMSVEYWGNQASASGYIHFWTQDIDGTNYTDQVQVNTGNANFNINDKFTGFYAYQYRVDNGTWQNVGALNPSTGIYGSPVSYRNRLDIRYNRAKATITFMDGAYFDGNGNPMDETPQAEEFYTTNEYFFGQDVSSYNKNGSTYYTPPAVNEYTFAGWYADDACTIPYVFGDMPLSGITVYAKWIKNQYRIFLHPSVPETDTTLNWGSEDQDMNFRVSSGSKVSAPTGTRSEYKFIGWYLDEACTEVFDADRFVLHDTTVTTPYDKTVDMTDPMNKYGNIEGTGYNSDLTGYDGGDRFWITRKLDLYAKWRAELIGAQGIGVKYDPNGGSGAPSDTTLYMDNTDTVAQGASTPSDDTQQFLYWVLQKWDSSANKYVDITDSDGHLLHVYPGDTFTVLKANALIEELEGSTEQDPKYRYTVQLRAEYGPKDEPTPTHLIWYGNGGVLATDNSKDRIEDPALQINQAEDIRPAGTFVRNGYEFLGWARVDSTTEGYVIEEKDLTRDDLFLKYEEGKFYAQVTDGSDEWTEVTQIAADEKDPYHDLYAVWDVKKYTVTVVKSVNGIESDNEIPFSFTPEFAGLSGETYTLPFQLVGKEGGVDIETVHYDHTKEFVQVPYDTEFSITEAENTGFDVICKYSVTDADDESENKTVLNVANGTTITVKGNVELTVINTRKTQQLKVLKTKTDGSTPLGGAIFTVNVGGVDYTLTSDSTDGYLKNEIFSDGFLWNI